MPELKLGDILFDDSKFHAQIRKLVRATEDQSEFTDMLAGETLNNSIFTRARDYDSTLIARWDGIRSITRFLLGGRNAKDRKGAIAAFNKLGPKRSWTVRNADQIGTEEYSAGRFLVEDILWLIDHPDEAEQVEREITPIIVINEIPGRRSASTLWLTVERRLGGDGLILADWWSMGLVSFGGEGESNFKTAIETAIWKANPKNGYRYTWRLKHHTGAIRPQIIRDRSAQAAAASCILALNERCNEMPGPLLDPKVVVSACLGETKEPGICQLQTVEKETFDWKLDAAANAELDGVIFCKGQWAAEKTTHEPSFLVNGNQEKKTVHLLGVDTLADAYDSLLITSKAIAQYKKAVAQDWANKWEERPTPEEYTRGAQR